MQRAFSYLLRPVALGLRNRVIRRERGDVARTLAFGGIGLLVAITLFAIVFWLTWRLLEYGDLGEYLVRLGLSWLFLTLLSFVTFSSLVISLSTFFLSEDLPLFLGAPVAVRQLFHSRFARALVQSSWMVVALSLPVLVAAGMARCAGAAFYFAVAAVLPAFLVIPVLAGTFVTLLIVTAFPARRARDILVLAGVFFAAGLIALLRYMRPERLVSVESLPDVTAFFESLDNPLTSLLPSFWAGEALFAGLKGRVDWMHLGALWSTACAGLALLRLTFERHYFAAWSKAQEARKVRFTRLRGLSRLVYRAPMGLIRRSLLLKDLKVFLRDTTQWSQLLLLLALAFVYLYSFRVLDPGRIPRVGDTIRTAYVFLNLAMASFVLAALSVRFVFPSVSAEGRAFWIVRTAPVEMSTYLWSKFWSGLVPVLIGAELLTLASNHLLHADPFLRLVTAAAIAVMSFALVGLATGMGALYPQFRAENVAQIAGSYGGLAYMVVALLYVLAEILLLAWPSSMYLWYQYRHLAMPGGRRLAAGSAVGLALLLSAVVFWFPMRRGVRALSSLEG